MYRLIGKSDLALTPRCSSVVRKTKCEIILLLRPAQADGRKPFAGYIKEEDSSIHVLLLADASEFVYRQLKRFEPELLASFQAK